MLVFTKNIIGFKTVICLCVCAILIAIIQPEARAAIRSTTGTIDFDSNNDGMHEASLTTTGLAIGPNLTPSTNLHVQGNSIISESLVIGSVSNSSSSTVHIHGTIGYGMQTVNVGGNNITSSIVIVDTSLGNVNLGLPDMTNSVGTKITIKRISLDNTLYLSASGGNIDGNSTMIISSGNLSYFTFINTGSFWTLMDSSESVSSAEVAAANLFLWWHLNESSGNVIADSSSYGYTGNLSGNANFSGNSVSGIYGTALQLDDFETALSETDDSAIIQFSSSLPSAQYTYSHWFKYNHPSTQQQDYSFELEGSAGFVPSSSNVTYHKAAYHEVSSGNYVSTALTSSLSANVWHHVAVRYDGSDLRLYLNGVFESNVAASGWTSGTNMSLENPGTYEDSVINYDQLRFYNTAITADEIQTLFYNGSPGGF